MLTTFAGVKWPSQNLPFVGQGRLPTWPYKALPAEVLHRLAPRCVVGQSETAPARTGYQ